MSHAPHVRPKDFADATGVTNGFASLVLKGVKPMPRRVAIEFFRKTTIKLGPIANATDDEIAVLEKFEDQRNGKAP